MRLAIISDVHSNLEALTAALESIAKRAVDEIICLGDIVGYGANPSECLKLVRERCTVILLGNHDAAAVDLSVANHFTLNARLAAIWTHRILSDEDKRFLSTLSLSKERSDILLVHASPEKPEAWNYVTTELEARRAFQSFTNRVCFMGHSHTPGIFPEKSKAAAVSGHDRFLVNVGSVGQPRDGNPKLSFGIFDTELWTYENVRAEYDVVTAAKKIREAGLPRVLAERLAVGI